MSYKNGSAFTGLAKEIEKMIEDAYRRGVADKEAEIANVLNMHRTPKAKAAAPEPAPKKKPVIETTDDDVEFLSEESRIDLARLKAYGERERAKGRAEVMAKKAARSKLNGEKWRGWAGALVNNIKINGLGRVGGPIPVTAEGVGTMNIDSNQKVLLSMGILRDMIFMSKTKIVTTAVACKYAQDKHGITSSSIHNATSLLVKAGYIENVCRGVYKATPMMLAAQKAPDIFDAPRHSNVLFDDAVPAAVADASDLVAAERSQG